MKKIYLLIVLVAVNVIAFGQRLDCNGLKCFTWEQETEMLKRCAAYPKHLQIIDAQDSTIKDQIAQIGELKIQLSAEARKLESEKRLSKLHEDAANAFSARLAENEKEVEKQKKKIKRLKRQRWIFGGIGVAVPVVLFFVL